MPRVSIFLQCVFIPFLQKKHELQYTFISVTTLSPLFRFDWAGTSFRIPKSSCPSISGSLTLQLPFAMAISVPHIPALLMLTTESPSLLFRLTSFNCRPEEITIAFTLNHRMKWYVFISFLG